jgi:hypothetical protein
MPDRSSADVVTLGESLRLLVAEPATALPTMRGPRIPTLLKEIA